MTKVQRSPFLKMMVGACFVLLMAQAAPTQAREEIPLTKKQMVNEQYAPKYAKNRWYRHRYKGYGGYRHYRGNRHRFRNYYGWNVGFSGGWRGGYYWRTVGYRCRGARCYKKMCLYRRGIYSPVRCKTRRWSRW